MPPKPNDTVSLWVSSIAAEQLLPLAYEQPRTLGAQKLAQEKSGQTVDATALVHEAYVRLVDGTTVQRWDSRGQFFAAAAEAMRRILVKQAPEHFHERGDHLHGGGQLIKRAVLR